MWNLTRDETNYGIAKRSLHGHNHFVSDVVISSDGQFALSGSWDTTLRLWDLSTSVTLVAISLCLIHVITPPSSKHKHTHAPYWRPAKIYIFQFSNCTLDSNTTYTFNYNYGSINYLGNVEKEYGRGGGVYFIRSGIKTFMHLYWLCHKPLVSMNALA